MRRAGRFHGAWIWFWFNDWTRLLIVGLGGHLLFFIPLLYALGVQGESLRSAAIGLYIAVFGWAMVDNDYTNLHKIGLDVYRSPLKTDAGEERENA